MVFSFLNPFYFNNIETTIINWKSLRKAIQNLTKSQFFQSLKFVVSKKLLKMNEWYLLLGSNCDYDTWFTQVLKEFYVFFGPLELQWSVWNLRSRSKAILINLKRRLGTYTNCRERTHTIATHAWNTLTIKFQLRRHADFKILRNKYFSFFLITRHAMPYHELDMKYLVIDEVIHKRLKSFLLLTNFFEIVERRQYNFVAAFNQAYRS